MQLGATFSHPHLKWLGLNPYKAIKEYKKLNLKWVRLGCYWNKIEKEEGKFDFSEIDRLIKFCEKNDLKIVLTVGMKAPRWPEYYIPDWLLNELNFKKKKIITLKDKTLLDKTLIFIEGCVKRYKKFSAIKVWQIENEPFITFGENNWRIDITYLEKEIELVRNMDPKRKILTSIGIDYLKPPLYLNELSSLIDIIGLDVYFKSEKKILNRNIIIPHPITKTRQLESVKKRVRKTNKELWIAELQAEPWETDGYDLKNPQSFVPDDIENNLNHILKLEPVLFWGFEFWYYRKIKGDQRYWNKARSIIGKHG